ncbi:MAG: zinc ribbon domain-containing protein [Ignavibacteria bacterium]|nr:zinc ribbon domain-containing protein [Ignavibacteria bacterium]
MPVFEYQCKECGKIYDILHKGAENTENVYCPSCNSKKHIKLISSFSSKISSGSSAGCSDGSCGIPSYGGGCAGGMCGLN